MAEPDEQDDRAGGVVRERQDLRPDVVEDDDDDAEAHEPKDERRVPARARLLARRLLRRLQLVAAFLGGGVARPRTSACPRCYPGSRRSVATAAASTAGLVNGSGWCSPGDPQRGTGRSSAATPGCPRRPPGARRRTDRGPPGRRRPATTAITSTRYPSRPSNPPCITVCSSPPSSASPAVKSDPRPGIDAERMDQRAAGAARPSARPRDPGPVARRSSANASASAAWSRSSSSGPDGSRSHAGRTSHWNTSRSVW